MTTAILFHHAQGLTAGVEALAGRLREAGHDIHLPDLYNGNTFATLNEGIAYAKTVGFGAIEEAGVAAAAGLGPGVVYIGVSLGVSPAQRLAHCDASLDSYDAVATDLLVERTLELLARRTG